MIEEYFLALDRDDSSRYSIYATAQIEPGPGDPDELYRMVMRRSDKKNLVFDAVFYPDRVDIQTPSGHTIEEIENHSVENSTQLSRILDSQTGDLEAAFQFGV